jgi:hypothetical protein
MKKHGPIITTFKQAKRVITVLFGFTLLFFGAVMLVTPGPGLPTIIVGLAVLGTEFLWARRLCKRFKDGANNIKNSVFNNKKNNNPSAGSG